MEVLRWNLTVRKFGKNKWTGTIEGTPQKDESVFCPQVEQKRVILSSAPGLSRHRPAMVTYP